jgi:hypothetical protein
MRESRWPTRGKGARGTIPEVLRSHPLSSRAIPASSLRDRTGAAGPYYAWFFSPTRAIPASSLRDRTGAAGPYCAWFFFAQHARSPHRRFATGPAQPVPTVPGSFSPNTRDPRIVASRPDRRSRSLLCLVHFADTRDPPHRRFAIGPAQPVPTVHFADTLDPCIVASRPDRRSRSLLCISPTSAIPPHRRFATGPAQPVPTAFRRHARSPHRRFATGPAQPVPTAKSPGLAAGASRYCYIRSEIRSGRPARSGTCAEAGRNQPERTSSGWSADRSSVPSPSGRPRREPW